MPDAPLTYQQIERLVPDLPEQYLQDVAHAVDILREGGCTAVFLFGSGARGTVSTASDIDLAVRGCPPEQFFRLLGQLLCELHYPVDLIDLERDQPFARMLLATGVLIRVG